MPLADNLVIAWELDEESDGSIAVARADSHSGNTLTDNNTTAIGEPLQIRVRTLPDGSKELFVPLPK